MIKWTRKNKSIAVKIFFVGIIMYVMLQSYFYKKSVLDNPYETTATITGIVNCFKNGRCIEYNYEYEEKKYTDKANSTWGFSNWCENKNDCKGFKFKITLNKGKPHQNIADWDNVFKKKQLTNFPKE